MTSQNVDSAVLKVGRRVRDEITSANLPNGTLGLCDKACDRLVILLKKEGVTASKHRGWCLYDHCEGLAGEPCAPHFYLLVHKGKQRVYLDVTADQFNYYLEKPNKEIMYGEKPYWLRPRKPSLREMELNAGY
jgi:hypothetical protein